MTIETAQDAMDALAQWHDENPGEISYAILEWTRDYFDNDKDATARDILHHLETIDCAGCHAPHGLIYNHEIADKVPLWWSDINEAIAEYHDETGEHPAPRDGSITIGWLVWFAVEWVGHNAARYLESQMEG